MLAGGALAALALATAALWLWPHARLLWWLHAHTEAPGAYVIPVAGVEAPELRPSFGAWRSHGRHEGIDIAAPEGTPVLAVADGVVYDDGPNPFGGKVIWLLGEGRRLYYYAHLRERAPAIRRGRAVRAGERIGSVGHSGNAVEDAPHLHFEILEVTNASLPLAYREIDPYAQLVWRGRTRAPEAGETPGAPPRWTSLPLDPAPEAGALAARLRASARGVEEMLEGVDPFLGVDADADVRRVAHLLRLAPRLRALADAAEREGDARRARLFLATQQLDALLAEWARCAPRQLGVALAALEGIALALEPADPARGEADGDPRRPDLRYLVFEGELPGVVPRQGGWLVAAGPGLAKATAGRAALRLRGGGRAVATRPTHPVGPDALALWVAPETLAEHAGACLSLALPADGAPAPADAPRPAAPGEAALPLCIPPAGASAWEMVARLAYTAPYRRARAEAKHLHLVNDSCDEPLHVEETLAWELPDGSEVLGLGDDGPVYEANAPRIACALEGARLRCQGTLPPSRCEPGESGAPTPVERTEWENVFAPRLRIPEPEDHVSEALSPHVETAREERICLELDREAASETSRAGFRLFAAHGRQRSLFFASPMETLRARREVRYELPAHRIEAELQPGDASTRARVCVAVHSEACRL